jgi:hypothetical protein
MKSWYSAFNAQGSRLIIVFVQLGAVKIYCSSSGGAQEKGKTGWNSVYHQIWSLKNPYDYGCVTKWMFRTFHWTPEMKEHKCFFFKTRNPV